MAISCSGIIHIVKQGDTLWSISRMYKLTVDDIINANPQIINPNNISVGQEICIPNNLTTLTPNLPLNNDGKLSLAYLFGGDSNKYINSIKQSKGNINEISPDFFEISPDGNLMLASSDKLNQEFIDNVKKDKIKIVPYISNNWDRDLGNKALDNSDAISTQIADAVKKYNLDGVNVDIENVDETYRDKYTEFVKQLREKLPEDKEVSVAVAANPEGWTGGWHGSYDYNALSKYADYLMIMNYDESYNGGPQGTISSKNFFEKSIEYAINQGVPNDKIAVGIPFFGRYWKEGEEIGGYGISDIDIKNLIDNYESNVNYDQNTKSTLATIVINENDTLPIVTGEKTLTPGTYYIWYDNADSTRYKLNSINSHNLKGVGSWALGQENPDIWDFYSDTLNGKKINPDTGDITIWGKDQKPDTGEISAPDLVPYSEKIIEALKNAGDTRNINEDSILTRGEAAVALAMLAGIKPDFETLSFDDTLKYWGRGYINSLYKRGILTNIEGDNFYPDKPATKEFIAYLINNILNLPTLNGLPNLSFKDILSDRWSYDAIRRLYYLNLINGENRDVFGPGIDMNLRNISQILDSAKNYDYTFKK